jgi:hypothetical protein
MAALIAGISPLTSLSKDVLPLIASWIPANASVPGSSTNVGPPLSQA